MNTSTISPIYPTANPLAYVDFTVRSFDCLVHLVYFAFVLLKTDSELHSRTCLLLHNVNATTFTISILYVIYIPSRKPAFADPHLNEFLCTLTELLWSTLKYARVWSLLLLAAYRYMACLNVQLYKRLNSRLLNLLGLILACWLVSLLVPVTLKLALRTTYSVYYCLDGFAPDRMTISIVYYVVNVVLSSAVPTAVILVFYVKIFNKLKEQTARTTITTNASSTQSNKLAKFARQFFVINALAVVSTVFSTFVDFVSVIATFPSLNYLADQLQYIRPSIRSLLLITESLVPVVSIYYTSWNWRLLSDWVRKRTTAAVNQNHTQNGHTSSQNV